MQLLCGTNSDASSGETVSPEVCSRVLLDGLPAVMWFIRRQMRKHRSGGLSVPQFRALALLDRFPTATLSAVAEYMGTSQPSASRLITGLVSKGFVTRRECVKDRRQINLVLTPRGRSALETARQATQQRMAERIQALSEADRSMIAGSMRVLNEMFGKNEYEAQESAGQALKKVVEAKARDGMASS